MLIKLHSQASTPPRSEQLFKRVLEATLHRYVWLYNQQLPQSALGSRSPLHAIKDWHKLSPALFEKQPYYLPGSDS